MPSNYESVVDYWREKMSTHQKVEEAMEAGRTAVQEQYSNPALSEEDARVDRVADSIVNVLVEAIELGRKNPTVGSAMQEQHGGSHYKKLAIQPIEYSQKNGLHACEHSAIKYLTRHKDKGGAEDVKKALHFCQLLLEIEYNIKSQVTYAKAEV